MHIHILGISGTFMGSLAAIAKESGFQVTGSDLYSYPPISDQLSDLGIEVIPNYDLKQLDLNPDLIVIGNVMTRGMPLVEAILNSDIPYTSGPEWLGNNILKDRTVIAVSGTHGKTTTASLIAFILQDLGYDPGYLIGGVPIGFSKSATTGSDPYFVIEADEYDTAFFDKRSKFIHYNPNFLVINNIEFDHVDIFSDMSEIYWQFHQLLRLIPSDTTVVANGDDNNIKQLFSQGFWSEKVTFGKSNKHDWSMNVIPDEGVTFSRGNEQIGQIRPQIIGQHNMMNILGATAALSTVGLENKDILKSIDRFPGVKRRLEFLGEHSGIKIFDDFAHHPTSIIASIDSLKDKYQGDGSLYTITELASNTMKKGTLREELVDSFDQADLSLIINNKDIEWDIEKEYANKNNTIIIENHEEIMDHLSDQLKPGDIILIMTNRTSVPIREVLMSIIGE